MTYFDCGLKNKLILKNFKDHIIATLKDLISVVETELALISCKYITNTCHSDIVYIF